MNKWICQLAFCCFVSPCLADSAEDKQQRTQEPPVIVHTGWRALTPEEIANLPIDDVPTGSRGIMLEVVDILHDLYPDDSTENKNVASSPKALIDYLNNLRIKIEKQQEEIDALDAKIASTEGKSSNLVRRRSEISVDMFYQKDLYDELEEFLQKELERQESRCSAQSK